MITTEIKAKELVDRFYNQSMLHLLKYDGEVDMHKVVAVECALICVNQIIDTIIPYKGMYDQEFFDADKEYWIKVKECINNLK